MTSIISKLISDKNLNFLEVKEILTKIKKVFRKRTFQKERLPDKEQYSTLRLELINKRSRRQQPLLKMDSSSKCIRRD